MDLPVESAADDELPVLLRRVDGSLLDQCVVTPLLPSAPPIDDADGSQVTRDHLMHHIWDQPMSDMIPHFFQVGRARSVR